MLHIINDVHIGFRRTGGTTPDSQEALRLYLLEEFEAAVSEAEDLVILGDLFDDFEVSPRDWLDTYIVLDGHLRQGKGLILVAGNHDWSPKANRISSFEALVEVLYARYADDKLHCVGINQSLELAGNFYVAHCSSQEVFLQRLQEVLAEVTEGSHVFLHANYDNNFAAQTDHSLNVPRELAREFKAKGATLVFAHEHQARRDDKSGVIVLGNQWPTSIIDCLGNTQKKAWIYDGEIAPWKTTWSADSDRGYQEINWRDLSDIPGLRGFVRIVGTATANEASDVINRIAKLRKDAWNHCFVIGNAVKVEGVAEAEDLPESFEAAKRFDVMDYIKQHLDAAEAEAVEDLVKGME